MANYNDKIFCKNFVNDVKTHYREYDYIYYKERCDLFKNLDCKQYYKSDMTISPGGQIKVLSIDSGVINGVVSLETLRELEDQASLELVKTKCHSISSNYDFDHTSSRQGYPVLGYTDSDNLDPTPLRWTPSIDDNSDL
jgi:hypothetical protein